MTDILHTDIASDSNGDWATTIQGDVATASDIDNLTSALRRRFETPLGALFYDPVYGNNLINRLSQPMTQSFEQDAISDVTSAMMGDPRVQSVTVQVTMYQESRTAAFKVDFVAIDGSPGSFESEVSLRV